MQMFELSIINLYGVSLDAAAKIHSNAVVETKCTFIVLLLFIKNSYRSLLSVNSANW